MKHFFSSFICAKRKDRTFFALCAKEKKTATLSSNAAVILYLTFSSFC